MNDLSEYKELIDEFLGKIEKLDMQCDFDSLSDRDAFVYYVIRKCRNKLMDAYNCIGDEGWVLPDLKW